MRDWLTNLAQRLAEASPATRELVPRLLAAAAILLLGWIAAKLVAFAVRRVSRRLRAMAPGVLATGTDDRFETVAGRALETLAYWLVFLLAAAAAAEVLGLSAITGGLAGFARYLPNVIAAVLEVIGGVIVANVAASWVRTSASKASLRYADSLAAATRGVLLVVTGIVALSELGIDSTLLIVAASTVLAAFLGGVALAFGLGAGTAVSNIVASHYAQRSYRVRQRIRIGAHEGRILEMLPTGVVVDTPDGPTFIPGKHFQEEPSVRLVEKETA